MKTIEDQSYTSTPEEAEFELRAHIGSIWSGGRLFIGMYTFLLASLVFAYFYLRSANNGLLWRPDHVTAPTHYGWAIFLATVATGIMAVTGRRRLRGGALVDWQVAGWTAFTTAAIALILQIWELSSLPFYPGSSGYASTFIGFSVFNIMTLVITTFWLETTLTRSHRLAHERGGNALLSTDVDAQSWRANVSAMTYFVGFVALSGAFLFAMFYQI